MMARLRPLIFLCIAAMLSACASSPSSTLGELPRTPQASTQQLLKEADASDPAKAALLRLSAADQAMQQGDQTQARQILEQIALDQLKPAQQMFAKTLEAELALAANEPERALQALQHPSFSRLAELPVRVRRVAGQELVVLRERVGLRAGAGAGARERIAGLGVIRLRSDGRFQRRIAGERRRRHQNQRDSKGDVHF